MFVRPSTTFHWNTNAITAASFDRPAPFCFTFAKTSTSSTDSSFIPTANSLGKLKKLFSSKCHFCVFFKKNLKNLPWKYFKCEPLKIVYFFQFIPRRILRDAVRHFASSDHPPPTSGNFERADLHPEVRGSRSPSWQQLRTFRTFRRNDFTAFARCSRETCLQVNCTRVF